MIHLEWEDIDFKQNRIHIVSKKDWHIKNYENRFIPMTPDLREHLKTLKRTSSYVLEPRHTAEVYSTYYRRILRKLGLKGSLHILRHSFASHLTQNGVRPEERRDLLGHRSIQTGEIYSHLAPYALESAMSKLPSLTTPETTQPRRKKGWVTAPSEGEPFPDENTPKTPVSDGKA